MKCYWTVDSYLSDDGVRNTMTRNRFINTPQNVHFTDNQTAEKSYKAYKMRICINNLNRAFQDAMSDAERQPIDEHMTKFKGRMSCNQYMKNKPLKWSCRCCSKQDICMSLIFILAKRKKTEFGLEESVVLDLFKKSENTHCILYFDNFFNSQTLVEKLFDRGIYCLGTVENDKKNMVIIKKNKDMKRGGIDFQYANNVVAVKWFDNRRVTMVGTFLEECNKVLKVTRRVKGQRL